MVQVHCLPVGEMGVNCYLVEDVETHRCLIVDPGDEGARIIDWIGDRKPCAVLLFVFGWGGKIYVSLDISAPPSS